MPQITTHEEKESLSKAPAAPSARHDADDETVLDLRDIFLGLGRFWWLCLILAVIGAGIMFAYDRMTFEPMYKASATFTVSTESANVPGGYQFNYQRSNTDQLASTFPYILESNILQDMIKEDVGTSELPVTISASAVPETNMFTLSVSGTDPQTTYDVLNSAIKNYPEVAKYVIGNSKLTMLEQPEIPTAPLNTQSYKRVTKIGALAGLMLGFAWVFIYTVFRKTIRSKDDITYKLNQKCIAALPDVTFKRHKAQIDRTILTTNPLISSSFKESVRLLRNNFVNAADGKYKVVMISSTAPGEGKSTVSVNLSVALAQLERRVLLIDGDIRKPSVGEIVGIEPRSPEEAKDPFRITEVKKLGIHVLDFAVDKKDFWKILNVTYLQKLISSLRDRYDYIIIDTSPAGLTTDPMIVAEVSDAMLFVVRDDTVRIPRIKSALDNLISTDTPLMGCIMNNAGLSGGFGRYGKYGYGKYGYGKYSYGYGYGYGYGEEKQQ